MKHKVMIAAGLLILALSCKKNETITATAPVKAPATMERLILSSAIAGNTTYSYAFNADRSLQKVTWSNGTVQKIFSYSGNKVTALMIQNNKKLAENNYELSNGIAQKQHTAYFDANGNITDTYVTTYTYNAKGLLEKVLFMKNGAGNGYSVYVYDNNNDLAEYNYYNSTGALQSSCKYQYDPLLEDKPASFGRYNTAGDDGLFPRLAKHLYVKTIVFYPAGNFSITYNYSYAMDTKGYVTKQVVKNMTTNLTEETNNTWE